MFQKIFLCLLVIMFFSGCLKDPVIPSCDASTYDPCALKAPLSEIQAVQDYLTSNGIAATQHCSGLFYNIDTMGNGVTPNFCSQISFNYVGKLTNGSTFDSSTNTATFRLFELIPGWRAGIPLIKSGGTIHLYVPPTLGYGSGGSGTIPGNSILNFRVDLVAVQ